MVVHDLDNENVYVITNDADIEYNDRVIDFSSFYHITSNRDCFSIYKPMNGGIVYLGDNIDS